MSVRAKRDTVKTRRTARAARPAPLAFPGTKVVRLERVAEARRRIASGWYDRADVRDRLVEAVLDEFRGR